MNHKCGVCRGRAASLPAREFSAPSGSDPKCPIHGFGQDVTRETFATCVEALSALGVVGDVKRERLLAGEVDVGECRRLWRQATERKTVQA